MTDFIEWYKYAIRNNKILWLTSSQANLVELFNAERIEQDITAQDRDKVNTSELKKLLDLVRGDGFHQAFSVLCVQANDGEKLRKGLADQLRQSNSSIEDILANPGVPPGVIVFSDKDCLALLQCSIKMRTVSPQEGIGLLQEDDKILVMEQWVNSAEQLALFIRDAWEKGRLIILISKDDKATIKSQVLLGTTSGHVTHHGKEIGNQSRLDSMVVTLSDFSALPKPSAAIRVDEQTLPSTVPKSLVEQAHIEPMSQSLLEGRERGEDAIIEEETQTFLPQGEDHQISQSGNYSFYLECLAGSAGTVLFIVGLTRESSILIGSGVGLLVVVAGAAALHTQYRFFKNINTSRVTAETNEERAGVVFSQ